MTIGGSVSPLLAMRGVIRYALIGLPPSDAGAVQLSATARSRETPLTPVGAPGSCAPGGGGVAMRTSSKSVVPVTSFQSWRIWRLDVCE